MVHQNSINNLIPLNQRPVEEQREIQSMGGKVRSEKKSLARKIDWLKRKGMTDEQVQELCDMLTNEDVSDLTLLEYIKRLKDMADESEDFNKIRSTVELLVKWRRERFGSKVNLEGNVTVDIGKKLDQIIDVTVEDENGEY